MEDRTVNSLPENITTDFLSLTPFCPFFSFIFHAVFASRGWQGRKIRFDPESDAFGRHSFGFVVCELQNDRRDRRSFEDELANAETHH